MNLSANDWFSLIALVFSILSFGGFAASYVMRNTSKDEAGDAVQSLQDGTITPLRTTVIDHDRRIIRVEEQIKALPQVDEVASLRKQISDIAGDIKAVSTEMRSLHEGQMRTERALSIVTESLMSNSK